METFAIFYILAILVSLVLGLTVCVLTLRLAGFTWEEIWDLLTKK